MTSVLVVDRSSMFGGRWPQGFTSIPSEQSPHFFAEIAKHARMEPRAVAERTEAWKQWIPYCLLTCGDHKHGDFAAFAVQRTRGQSEGRLHGSWSLGIGGHIDAEDVVLDTRGKPLGSESCRRALERELAEELDLPLGDHPAPSLLGMINDDSTEVGAVHAGLAYHLHLSMPLAAARGVVKVRETAKMHGGFTLLADLPTLWHNPDRLESWSKLLLDSGIRELTAP